MEQRLDPLITTFDRANPPSGDLYIQSYLLIRTLVGLLGIALPLAFIVGEAFIDGQTLRVRGSVSAYCHSSMHDLYVGGLCVIGFLLATYLSGKTRSLDFRLSLVAGIAVLGVAFPMERPAMAEAAPRCGSQPMPPECAAIQQRLGETVVATLHFLSAATFILSLAAIAFVFARREQRFEGDVRRARFQRLCGVLILRTVA